MDTDTGAIHSSDIEEETPENEKVSKFTRLCFASGAIGEAVYGAVFNAFIIIFYNQAIGLSNTLIGVAIMLATIGDAVTDPIIGVVSDRWRSKHGRRHPFLFVAPLPLALSLYFIFNPPAMLMDDAGGADQFMLFLWLSVWTILSRAFLTLYSIPHISLGAELSKDQHQRSLLFSANTIATYISGAAFAFVAWSVFFAGERTRASDGQLVPAHLDAAAYGPMVFTACALILIGIWFCAASTYKFVPRLSQAKRAQNRLTVIIFLKEMLSTLKNRNYVFLLLGFFFFMISAGISETLHIFTATYFWELKAEELRWIGVMAAPAALLGALSSPALMRRYDRKPLMVAALFAMAVFAQLSQDLRLLGLFPENGSPALLPLLIVNASGFICALGIAAVAVLSMISDVIDENELATGLRQEGLFYSSRAFFAKAANSIGHLFGGVMLDVFVRLPFGAVPGQLDEGVIMRLGLASGPIMGLFALISLVFYSRYNLSRERHKEILLGLKNKPKSNASDSELEQEFEYSNADLEVNST
jgi:GPH family glycoside/pentoside/hexuronide:cation symporter